ncbi:MAG: hypothetical protein JNJ46_34440 [Myxococcales bacterium]|nr:hypothetical protein [Myxococcales bacterium]
MSKRSCLWLFSLALSGPLGGCSGTAQRTLVLIPPIAEPCDSSRDPGCTPVYDSCESLKLSTLRIEVGLFHRAGTDVPCPPELGGGTASVTVSYGTGEDFYMIDASYSRNAEKQNITAGPFLESDREWRLVLR